MYNGQALLYESDDGGDEKLLWHRKAHDGEDDDAEEVGDSENGDDDDDLQVGLQLSPPFHDESRLLAPNQLLWRQQ